MTNNIFSSFFLIFWASLSLSSHAACVPNTIDERRVSELPEELTLTDLVKLFGNGCLGGMTAVTYQFQGNSGKPVWFWLKNNPEPAIVLIQRSMASGTPPDIEVFIGVIVEGEGREDTIIWPKSLIGISSNQVLHAEYFKKRN